MSYGLLGKTLSHSFSKDIHEQFSKKEYTLFESDDLKKFFAETSFSGLNVTIPYKHDVIKYLTTLSREAEAIGAVNTILNKNGNLIGYNTDYYGLEKALEYYNISVSNQEIIILGNGSTSKTIAYYCTQNNAKNITILARNPGPNEYHFNELNKFQSTTIVFNATPVGMFPNNKGTKLISLDSLPYLTSVVDLVYNPLNTSIILAARKRNIKAVNGLLMLIYQAVKAIEIFHNIRISNIEVLKYYKNLKERLTNFVFIGMPMSGKTFFSHLVAKKFHKQIVDLDSEIEKNIGTSIDTYFKIEGEAAFRNIESSMVQKYSKHHNYAISCGGGVILNKENITMLKQNGVIIFIDMPLSLLEKCNPKGRPLLKDKDNLAKIYQSRYHLYLQYADIVIEKYNFNESATLRQIEVKIHEYFNSKWS